MTWGTFFGMLAVAIVYVAIVILIGRFIAVGMEGEDK